MTNVATTRDFLAAPALRQSLTAMVRRRVPASEAEDVAQTILCDALAAPAIPSDPEEMRRFVAGIARHKVADFHRRQRPVAANDVDEEAAPPAPIEARVLLSRIAASVSSSRERETLDWLLREHDGEQLQTIAAESGLPAPAVRQRVSRLRRMLRAQWAIGLLFLVGASGMVAYRMHSETGAITADPTGDPIANAALSIQGEWYVESTNITGVQAKALDVRVTGRRVEVSLPTLSTKLTLTNVHRNDDGSLDLTLADEKGWSRHLTARGAGEDRVVLTAGKDRAVLVRR